ncbi:hypothetical protein K0W35_001188 [Vibrio parahaemolyticus]|nr:hypothetical protein [Vibrio parahaemolyticus]
MAIRKAKQKSNFTQIPNETIQDENLTFEARGVLALLLSNPYDGLICKRAIQFQAPKFGKDKLHRILKELERFGYLQRERPRNKNGTFARTEWLLRDTLSADAKELHLQEVAEVHLLWA